MGKKSIKYLDSGQLARLRSACSASRDKILIDVLYETGCTVQEVVNIKVEHIDFSRALIHIPSESRKAGKDAKKCFISHSLRDSLQNFASSSQEYLFSTRQSLQITTKRARQIVQKCAKGAHLGKIGPQVLRYTHIAHALKKGISLSSIQKQLGMKQLRAVQIYQALGFDTESNSYQKLWQND